jgi:hypothetical protein
MAAEQGIDRSRGDGREIGETRDMVWLERRIRIDGEFTPFDAAKATRRGIFTSRSTGDMGSYTS